MTSLQTAYVKGFLVKIAAARRTPVKKAQESTALFEAIMAKLAPLDNALHSGFAGVADDVVGPIQRKLHPGHIKTDENQEDGII